MVHTGDSVIRNLFPHQMQGGTTPLILLSIYICPFHSLIWIFIHLKFWEGLEIWWGRHLRKGTTLCSEQRYIPQWGMEVTMKWLPPEEVIGLTGYKHHQKQVEALNQMGINHTVRPDGAPVIFVNDLTNEKRTSGTYKTSFVIDKGNHHG